jgi:hypothetical protein
MMNRLRKIKKANPFKITMKNKIPRNKFNETSERLIQQKV